MLRCFSYWTSLEIKISKHEKWNALWLENYNLNLYYLDFKIFWLKHYKITMHFLHFKSIHILAQLVLGTRHLLFICISAIFSLQTTYIFQNINNISYFRNYRGLKFLSASTWKTIMFWPLIRSNHNKLSFLWLWWP